MSVVIGGGNLGVGLQYLDQQDRERRLRLAFLAQNEQARQADLHASQVAAQSRAANETVKIAAETQRDRFLAENEQQNRFHQDQQAGQEAALHQQAQLRQDTLNQNHEQFDQNQQTRKDQMAAQAQAREDAAQARKEQQDRISQERADRQKEQGDQKLEQRIVQARHYAEAPYILRAQHAYDKLGDEAAATEEINKGKAAAQAAEDALRGHHDVASQPVPEANATANAMVQPPPAPVQPVQDEAADPYQRTKFADPNETFDPKKFKMPAAAEPIPLGPTDAPKPTPSPAPVAPEGDKYAQAVKADRDAKAARQKHQDELHEQDLLDRQAAREDRTQERKDRADAKAIEDMRKTKEYASNILAGAPADAAELPAYKAYAAAALDGRPLKGNKFYDAEVRQMGGEIVGKLNPLSVPADKKALEELVITEGTGAWRKENNKETKKTRNVRVEEARKLLEDGFKASVKPEPPAAASASVQLKPGAAPGPQAGLWPAGWYPGKGEVRTEPIVPTETGATGIGQKEPLGVSGETMQLTNAIQGKGGSETPRARAEAAVRAAVARGVSDRAELKRISDAELAK